MTASVAYSDDGANWSYVTLPSAPGGVLNCLTCGEACITPVAHLAREQVATSHLESGDPCLNYEETNKWGSRWRVVEAMHNGSLNIYVDHMGNEDDFKIGGISIPSIPDDHPSYWNPYGECLELARATHTEESAGYKRTKLPRATGELWANQMMEMAELKRRRDNHIGTFGSHIGVIR